MIIDKVKTLPKCKALNCGGLKLKDCSSYPCPSPYSFIGTIHLIKVCAICGLRVFRKNTTFYSCAKCGLLLEHETKLKDMSDSG